MFVILTPMYRVFTADDALAISRCAVTRDDKDLKQARPCQCDERGCDGLLGFAGRSP